MCQGSVRGGTDLVSVVEELQDGEDAGTDEQPHLTPDVPWWTEGEHQENMRRTPGEHQENMRRT